jgi:chaperonin GroES
MAATMEARMALKPLGDRVVIEVIEEAEQKTAGGLYVPDTAKEKSQRGKVIAVGGGKTLDNGSKVAVEVKEGDTVYFAKYGGTEISLEGKNYTILSERDILAVIG